MSPTQHWQTKGSRPGASNGATAGATSQPGRQAANKGQNANSDMAIRLGCHGTKVWQPNGITATLPF
ncbi:hypothetical protein MN608_10128 [Microdochium nivale]|nr:hypothetical protein MN608_10128 [Microdochium nivale]